ncbi:MAG: phosphohydrolase [Clostridia bacterium]|nr:phosphohydrolase [Clostridia bacterium]
MSTMNTYTGRKFDPMTITPADIDGRDVAHALSMMCRGNGHLRRFYSVAQHSLNCAKEAKARRFERRVVLACLLHDASEAYIADIIRPVKEHLPGYLDIESRIMAAVFARFGLSDLDEEEHAAWKLIDDDLLETELHALLPGEEERVPVPLMSEPDLAEHSCRKIEREFLIMLEELISFE